MACAGTTGTLIFMNDDIDEVRKAEDRRVTRKSDVPDDVKSEMNERVERREEADEERGRGDGP